MNKKIVTIVGARPQFIKAAPLSKELRKQHLEILVHTGQHYDYGMSDVFFEELQIPKPEYHLGVGSGGHGKQTGAMLSGIEEVLLENNPDLVIVYGDTNSTLAGALAASKLHIPIAHVEAGLRSFNRDMPEEINRILTDHISNYLFTPSTVANKHLEKEGIVEGVYDVGDIMYDAILDFSERAKDISRIIETQNLVPSEYFLATIHRAENTDVKDRLKTILEMFSSLNRTVVLPIHPRTSKKISDYGFKIRENIKMIEPVGYLDMIRLMQNSSAILTDSGGIQKESYYLHVPCVTLRDETEWVETVEAGWNKLCGVNVDLINKAMQEIDSIRSLKHPDLYGNGSAAKKIVDVFNQIS